MGLPQCRRIPICLRGFPLQSVVSAYTHGARSVLQACEMTSAEGAEARERGRLTHIEKEYRGELGRYRLDLFVERLTGFGPRCPKVETGDSGQIFR